MVNRSFVNIGYVASVMVKARIQVDTSILDKHIAEIMKEKGTLAKLAEEQAKVKELEGKLSTIKYKYGEGHLQHAHLPES